MATSQDFVNWVCGPELDPEYLYFSFRLSDAFFNNEKQGSTHKTIYFPTVKRFHVLLPPLSEQKRVVKILDAADELRTQRRKALGELDALVQSAFIEIFGDPVANLKGWPQKTFGEIAVDTKIGLVRASTEYGRGMRFPYVRMDSITSD